MLACLVDYQVENIAQACYHAEVEGNSGRIRPEMLACRKEKGLVNSGNVGYSYGKNMWKCVHSSLHIQLLKTCLPVHLT